MNDLNSKVSEIVGRYINAKNISQDAISKKIGVSQSSLSRALTGDRAWLVRDVQALANIGVDFSHLFDNEEV